MSGDEFSGSSVDASKWSVYDPAAGMGNYGYTDPYFTACLTKKNVTVANGSAVIKAKKQSMTCNKGRATQHTAGFLSSREVKKFYPLYGRFEMRARIPHGQGIWPAFWLRHVNGASTAEIDIVEIFHSTDPGTVLHTLHFPSSIGTNVKKVSTPFETPVKGTGGWHTFAVDIEQVYPGRHDAVKFTFRVDGVKTMEYVNTNASKWTSVADKSKVWDIAINTAVGGKWVGHPDQKLGWFAAMGGACSLERAQRLTTNAGSCDDERTPGKWYRATMPKAPSQNGTPDIWLAPWNYSSGASSDYVIDYFRYYSKA